MLRQGNRLLTALKCSSRMASRIGASTVELLFLVNRLKPHTNDVGLLGTRPRKILASSREYQLIMISTRFKAGL